MHDQFLFQLLTPIIYLIFAIGFVRIWVTSKKLTSSLLFGASFIAMSMAFFWEFARGTVSAEFYSLTINLLYLVSVCCLVAATWMRSRWPVPMKTLLVMSGLFLGGTSYMVLSGQDILQRTIWTSLSLGLICALSLPAAFGINRGPLDRMIAYWITLATAQFYIRPAMVFWLHGTEMSEETYSASAFNAAVHFSATLIGLLIATALLTSYVLKIVSDLQKTSQTDPLTGCLNRRGLQDRADYLQSFCARKSAPMAVVLVDIDDFKSVNDSFGHLSGDEVLQRLGGLLGDTAGLSHAAGRLGGEEFALVMSNTDLDSARKAAENLRCTFSREEFIMAGTTRSLTASFGVASLDPKASLTEAIERADKALYASKAAGRDRVTDELETSVKELRSLDGFTKTNAASLLKQAS
ncbi:MAG: GGDEF domain-containing protein [Pseudomonadota bacterium]